MSKALNNLHKSNLKGIGTREGIGIQTTLDLKTKQNTQEVYFHLPSVLPDKQHTLFVLTIWGADCHHFVCLHFRASKSWGDDRITCHLTSLTLPVLPYGVFGVTLPTVRGTLTKHFPQSLNGNAAYMLLIEVWWQYSQQCLCQFFFYFILWFPTKLHSAWTPPNVTPIIDWISLPDFNIMFGCYIIVQTEFQTTTYDLTSV